MPKTKKRPFRVHPGIRWALADFAFLELDDVDMDAPRRAVIQFMQDQIREVLSGQDPHDLWLAVSVPGREVSLGDAERDCSIATSILLEGYKPSLRKGELDAIKLKVERDWNEMRDRIGPGSAQPPRITEAIVQHAWHRCLASARKKMAPDEEPCAFRVVRSEDENGRLTVMFDPVLSEPEIVREARRRWREEAEFRCEFPTESICVAYYRAIASGRVSINGQPPAIDHE